MTFDTNTVDSQSAETTVQVTSDTGSILGALAATFTRGTTVIGELLQNARRAGATRIDITLTENLLMFEDDGKGIEDFSVLLAMAKSNWSEEVVQQDSPYGLGFIAALFACGTLGVQSKGKHLFASTADLIALKPVPVNESIDTGKTEIRLHDYKIGNQQVVASALANYTRGFPLPVFINGNEVERNHALDASTMVETSFGWASVAVLRGGGIGNAYLQGLPVTVDLGRWFGYTPAGVVHLDSTRFKGRLPDRDSLIDPEVNSKKIQEELDVERRKHLTELAKTVPHEQFVDKYWDVAVKLELYDLLNSLDFVPGHVFFTYSDNPRVIGSDGDPSFRTEERKAISREQLEREGVFLVGSARYGWDDDNLLGAHIAYAKGGYVLKDNVLGWHWVSKLAQQLDPEHFTLEVEAGPGEDLIEVDGRTVKLNVCKKLSAVYYGPDASDEHASSGLFIRYGAQVEIEMFFDSSKNTLYVTEGVCKEAAYAAVWQISSFEEDDTFISALESDSVSSYRNVLATILGGDPGEALLHIIQQSLYSGATPKALRGKSFTVTFNEDGMAEVSLQA